MDKMVREAHHDRSGQKEVMGCAGGGGSAGGWQKSSLGRGLRPRVGMHWATVRRSAGLKECPRKSRGHVTRELAEANPGRLFSPALCFAMIHSGLLVVFTNSRAKAGKQDQVHGSKAR